MSYNIIGDIAGQYDAFLKLVEKMPAGKVISVGDLVDRGPKSKEVVEWFMNNPEAEAIYGNHEHLMIDTYRKTNYYEDGTWYVNGGSKTVKSYGKWVQDIPEEVIKWLENRPKYLLINGVFVSHSFLAPNYSLEEALDFGESYMDQKCDPSIIWNREPPIRRPEYKLQVAGHNSQFKLRRFVDDQGEFAICLDDSNNDKLTGLHIPSMEIYQEEF
jgi:hypothetical protein